MLRKCSKGPVSHPTKGKSYTAKKHIKRCLISLEVKETHRKPELTRSRPPTHRTAEIINSSTKSRTPATPITAGGSGPWDSHSERQAAWSTRRF